MGCSPKLFNEPISLTAILASQPLVCGLLGSRDATSVADELPFLLATSPCVLLESLIFYARLLLGHANMFVGFMVSNLRSAPS